MRLARAGLVVKTPWLGLGLGLLAAIWAHVAIAVGGFDVGVFDPSLRLVEANYAARGLKTYGDFGLVYPPWVPWFYGSLLRLWAPGQVVVAHALVSFSLVLLLAWRLFRLAPEYKHETAAIVLAVFGVILPVSSQVIGVPVDTLALLPLTVVLTIEVLQHGSGLARLFALAGIGLVQTLNRWDWPFAISVFLLGWAAAAAIVATMPQLVSADGRAVLRRDALRLAAAAGAMACGIVAAAVLIVLITWGDGTFKDAVLFIFQVPLRILPYRHLPIPAPRGANVQWLLNASSVCLVVLAGYLALTKTTRQDRANIVFRTGILVLPCVALLPYAVTRADAFHFVALVPPVVTAALVGRTMWQSRPAKLLLALAIAIIIVPSAFRTLHYVVRTRAVPPTNFSLQRERAATAACNALVPANAKSLFVGQVRYDLYSTNLPIFYLLQPKLDPASPFIDDEPGLQNTCDMGARIGENIKGAKRPVVLILDTQPANVEPNAMRTMKSCGKIEAAIASLKPVTVGTCALGDRTLKVQVAE